MSARNRGFTLLEVMLCLLLSAILAGLTVAGFGEYRRAAKLRSAVMQWMTLDQTLRTEAAKCEGMLLDVNVATGQATVRTKHRKQVVPADVADERTAAIALRRPFDSSTDEAVATLAFDASGRSSSYAVLLEAGGKRQWLLAAGLTGQIRVLDNESELENIYATMRRASRDDAR